jgi:hypothetical protein
MGRILLLLSLCLISSCYPYPPYDSGYRQPYPPGYWAGYPAYGSGSYAGPQDYAPHDQQHYREYGGPGDATSAPAQGYDQPSYGPPSHDQIQPEYYGGRQHEHAGPSDCDSPTNPMACN